MSLARPSRSLGAGWSLSPFPVTISYLSHVTRHSPITLQVDKQHAGSRLDRFLALTLPTFSRARLQTLIRENFVTLNGKVPRPRDPVRTGDTVELTEPEIEKIEA